MMTGTGGEFNWAEGPRDRLCQWRAAAAGVPHGHDMTAGYPELGVLTGQMKVRVIVDGEVIALCRPADYAYLG